jgi:hypothetical protein
MMMHAHWLDMNGREIIPSNLSCNLNILVIMKNFKDLIEAIL